MTSKQKIDLLVLGVFAGMFLGGAIFAFVEGEVAKSMVGVMVAVIILVVASVVHDIKEK